MTAVPQGLKQKLNNSYSNVMSTYMRAPMTNILVVGDHSNTRKTIVSALRDQYEISEIDQAEKTYRMIKEKKPSIILIDRLSKGFDAYKVFEKIKEGYPDMPVLLYVQNGSDALESIKQSITLVLKNHVNTSGCIKA